MAEQARAEPQVLEMREQGAVEHFDIDEEVHYYQDSACSLDDQTGVI
jgi:hypothetical protein